MAATRQRKPAKGNAKTTPKKPAQAAPARELVTQAEYARRIGVSRAYVAELRAKGVIVLVDGKVDVLQADAAIAAAADPRYPRRRQGHTSRPAAAEVGEDEFGEDYQKRFNRARALKEEQLARQARIKADEDEGRLVEADAVHRQSYDAGRILQSALLSAADRIAAEIAAVTGVEVAAVYEILDREHRQCLKAFSQSLRELAPSASSE